MTRIKTTAEVAAKSPGNMTAPNLKISSHNEHDDKVYLEVRENFPKIVVTGDELILAIKKCMNVETT